MKVVLTEKINKLGDLGDVVQVKAGYARNYLVPYGKARHATAANIRSLEEARKELLLAEQRQFEHAQRRREELRDAVITIPARASDNNKLFGSVTAADVAESIKAQLGVDLDKKEIIPAPDGPIRALGEYGITIRLHADIKVEVTVRVVATTD